MSSLIDEVIELYGLLDFEELGTAQGPVRVFHREDAAVHVHDLVWVLDSPPTPQGYREYTTQLSRIAGKPGSLRQRVVVQDRAFLSDLDKGKDFPLDENVQRADWTHFLNKLFHTDRFCDKVQMEYIQYRDNLSQQMRAFTGAQECTYEYVPQYVSTHNGERIGLVTKDFFASHVLIPQSEPTLYIMRAPAGYGKTASSYEIAHILSEKHKLDPSVPFPIFIPFSKYRRFGGVRDILRAEIEELKLYGVNSLGLMRVVQDGHAVVILDGFDELMAEVGKASAKANLAAISEFLKGKARVILTSRSAFLSTSIEVVDMMENRIAPTSVKILTLSPFDTDQQRAYFSKLKLPRQLIEDSLKILSSHPHVHELCKSPLMLNSVAYLASKQYNGDLNIDLLYSHHFTLLFDRERERQKHDLSNELQMAFVSGIASNMYLENTFSYDPESLSLFWDAEGKQLLLSAGYQPTDIEGLRTKLMCHAVLDSSAGVLDPIKEQKGIQFLHPSFRDFLVASRITTMAGRPGAPSISTLIAQRQLSQDLGEMLACRIKELDKYLTILLRDPRYGVRNGLSIMMAAIRLGLLNPEECERKLAAVNGGKSFTTADFSGLRFQRLLFEGWDFANCIFSEAQFTDCAFTDCNLERALLYSCRIFGNVVLKGSRFGRAAYVNGLGILDEGEIEVLYDNEDIRMWLISQGAVVETADLPLLKPTEEQEIPLGRQLVIHVWSKYFPRGSDKEQRHKKVGTFATSLPAHNKRAALTAVEWLKKRGVLEDGPQLSGGRTLAISQSYRDEIRAFMRLGSPSQRITQLLTEADRIL